jgi:hypothetical protein
LTGSESDFLKRPDPVPDLVPDPNLNKFTAKYLLEIFMVKILYTVILFPNLCLGFSKLHRLTKKDLNMNLVSSKHEFVFLLDIQMSLILCLDPSKYDE